MKPFQSISETVRSTGLSSFYLRRGCKDGTVPHIMSGAKYIINVPALLKQLGVPEERIATNEQTRTV